MSPEALLRSMAAAAVDAGALLRAMQPGSFDVTKKGLVDLVTDADRAAEALLQERLSDDWPGCRLHLEEEGHRTAPGGGHESVTFVVDPLDGTTNFAARQPHFAVSVAAVVDDEGTVAGCVYDPWRDELFSATRGGGAFLGDHPLAVSRTDSLGDSVLATGFAYGRMEDRDDNHAEFCALNLRCRGVRRYGAATLDLAWLAAGRFDGYWERGLKPWDLAAGVLLVEEAGGRVNAYGGGPFDISSGEVLASNGPLHEALDDAVCGARRAAGF
jgi:myo-inositol-1(or 4)-monophosphatase